jgi:hypothetical protein
MNLAADTGTWDWGQTPTGCEGMPCGKGADADRRRGYAVRHGGRRQPATGVGRVAKGQLWPATATSGGESERGGRSLRLTAARSAGGGSDQIGATVTGARRDGVDNRRVARATLPRGAGSWSSHEHRTYGHHPAGHDIFIVGDPVGESGSPQSSRLTSASPAGSRRRLRQRRSCRESTSRSPGARRSARYLFSELSGGEHPGEEHGGHQPGALLVLGQVPQPVALKQDA